MIHAEVCVLVRSFAKKAADLDESGGCGASGWVGGPGGRSRVI